MLHDKGRRECRAARFSLEVKDPSRRPDLRQEARKQRALAKRRGPEFVTGIDLFSEVHLGASSRSGVHDGSLRRCLPCYRQH